MPSPGVPRFLTSSHRCYSPLLNTPGWACIRKCQGLLFLLLGMLLVACTTVEAPEQPEAITLGIGTSDGSCGTSELAVDGAARILPGEDSDES